MKMAKASERDMEQNTTKERPILFSGAMVRAILSGQKTQTRRCMKPQPYLTPEWDSERQIAEFYMADECVGTVTCPYGQPGDRLWVRESWGYRGSRISTAWPGIQKVDIDYRADGQRIEYERPANDDSGIPKQRPCREDEDYIEDYYNGYLTRYWKQWRPSIHMPRWACRIVLEIVSVRVERLRDISVDDALAEGILADSFEHNGQRYFRDYRLSDAEASTQPALTCPIESFRSLWESINGPESWQANPWVWVVEFRKVAA